MYHTISILQSMLQSFTTTCILLVCFIYIRIIHKLDKEVFFFVIVNYVTIFIYWFQMKLKVKIDYNLLSISIVFVFDVCDNLFSENYRIYMQYDF